MTRTLCLAAAVLLVPARIANPTTVIPPSFDALVSRARIILVAEVIDQRAYWSQTPKGRVIRTQVMFKVEDVWKGTVGAVTHLDFLGGTVGSTTMEVVGTPVFAIGQRNILFVAGVPQVTPLVGFMHGRMHVERDRTGLDWVKFGDGYSMRTLQSLSAQTGRPIVNGVLRLTDVASAVKAQLEK